MIPRIDFLRFAYFLPVILASLMVSGSDSAKAQPAPNAKYGQVDKFRQLGTWLRSPNVYRNAAGAPGHAYWQQKVDYAIDVELNDKDQTLHGKERISYQNNSPDSLRYLWLQLDANLFAKDSDAAATRTAPQAMERMSFDMLKAMQLQESFDGGVHIEKVTDHQDNPLPYVVVKTMMRVDLPEPLGPGQSVTFQVDWHYAINDTSILPGRTGFEYFEEDKNYIYEMAQWFPRLCAYTDVHGWQHKQYLGRGEFTLELGDYLVRITAPADHLVAATGELVNASEVLSETQRQRWEEAKSAKKPVFIVTPEEAKTNESSRAETTKTWIFRAAHVRDFAFASSRKFIWDAQLHDVEGNRVMAMSYYPNEGEPLWSKYSTHSIIHTLNVYSRYTFPYPYPVAISVNGPVGGMEYPMICFNGPRPEKDGTYSERTKYGLISVIIHEVGHNYFPMIVNSDERRWTWMDEGLNTFLQYLSEQEWEEDYPSRRGEPKYIVPYMLSKNQVPIMTQSDSILQFGHNAYSKPATALNILRETILGRELFDFAFKEYARRWRFKRPTPDDFFRTMEDASGVDLDWFWRGWFFSTDHCDIAIQSIKLFEIDTKNPDVEKGLKKQQREAEPETLSDQRNKSLPKRVDQFGELKDFYNSFDELDVTAADREAFDRYLKSLDDEEKKILARTDKFYVLTLSNEGGLVMPVIIELEFEDGSKRELRIPAEIWRFDNQKVSKLIMTDKLVKQWTIDPHLETADADLENNFFPPKIVPSRFELYKGSRRSSSGSNPMRAASEAAKKAAEKK